MVDYINVLQVGCSILIIIVFGFIAFKFKFAPLSAIQPMNQYLYKVCYILLIFRNLGKRKFSDLNFYPFIVGALTTITIAFLFFFLIPFKDKFKNYLGAVLPCAFVNYLVIGLPLFDSMWDPEEDIVVPMISLSNDLITTPIYLVLSNIYLAKRAESDLHSHKQPLNEQKESDDNDKSKKSNPKKENKPMTKCGLVKHILLSIITNPIIIGNIIGFIWSGIGWTFPTFLTSFSTFLGDEVLGICLICVGGFIAQNSIMACNWLKFAICIIGRHIICPLTALLYSWGLGLSNKMIRQCTLMALMPTGTTSFLMSSLNGIGPGVSSTMIFWSTILCVPFLILWIFVLDQLHLFVEE